jgi:hypothetical protein
MNPTDTRTRCERIPKQVEKFCCIIPVTGSLREDHRLRVFENRVLRRIFGPKRDEVMGGWRKLHKEELYNLYSSPNIIRMIKSWRMRWAGQVARMGRGGMHKGFWWGSQKHYEDPDTDGRILLT